MPAAAVTLPVGTTVNVSLAWAPERVRRRGRGNKADGKSRWGMAGSCVVMKRMGGRTLD